MFNCCRTSCLKDMPDIVVYMNCDTRLAINLGIFDLGENDEFIFAIKNYNYIDSPYVFLFRARKEDIDENGEVIFKITPEASKHLKPGAFYNFALLVNAFDKHKETEYRKITDNGNIIIEYGAQDLVMKPDGELYNIYLEEISEEEAQAPLTPNAFMKSLVGMRVEEVE